MRAACAQLPFHCARAHARGQHKTFASQYNLEFLVYYEKFVWVEEAIAKEKEIKKWRREKKMDLIRSMNPDFEFLNHHFQ